MFVIDRRLSGALSLLVLVAAPLTCVTAEIKDSPKLPPPLDAITYDLGNLVEHFKVVECKHFGEGEFSAGERVVAEETIVWTLEAERAMKGDAVFKLLHPNP